MTTKVNPGNIYDELHLTAAYAVAMVAAVTGYRYNPKVAGDGLYYVMHEVSFLPPMTTKGCWSWLWAD